MLSRQSTNREGDRAVRLLGIDDAADMLGCSSKSVRRYIAEGRLPAQRLGSRMIRVREVDVLALLQPIPTANAS